MSGIHSLSNPELVAQYRAAGFGGRVGWGRRPALLVIDMAVAWTTAGEQLASDLSVQINAICRLLEIFRAKDLPRYFTTMAYDASLRDVGKIALAKTPHLRDMVRGSERVRLRPELQHRRDEILLEKPRPDAFWGTNLAAQLVSDDVDTVVITGCSTSGCIRGTAESAFNRNLHVILPREAIGDRSSSAHEASLFDMDNRYGDVGSLDEVLASLSKY